MRAGLALAVLLLFAAVFARDAAADRAAAEFFTQRGDKAVKDRDPAGAQEHYRRALEEDATYLPARCGLAEALIGAGDRGAGVEELRRFVTECEALAKPPAAWAPILARAKKRLADVDAAGTQLASIADKYAADMLALGDRWAVKDAEIAALAYREVLKVRPGHAKAQAALDKTGKPEAVRRQVLFDGTSTKGWMWVDDPHWALVDGALVGDVPNDAMIVRSEAEFGGDFDVRMEARVLEVRGDPLFVAVMACFKENYRTSTFGAFEHRLVWQEEHGQGQMDESFGAPFTKLAKPIDLKAWTWYEMRFRGDTCTALVDGTVVATVKRDPDRDRGAVALRVQNAKVAIRTVDVLPH